MSVRLIITPWPYYFSFFFPPDPLKSQMLMMTLGGVIPTAICLFVLAAVGGFAYYYICGHKPRLPKSVVSHISSHLTHLTPFTHQYRTSLWAGPV